MAFNPFTTFRKHQKVFFAVLTIVCMFTFILSFGRGDLFEHILRIIGMKRAKGEEVTQLYGKSIREGDLQQLYQQRLLAAGLMTSTAEVNLVGFMQEVAKEMNKPQVRQNPDTLHELADRFVNLRPMAARRMTLEALHREIVSDLQTAVRASEAPGLEKNAELKMQLDTAAEALAFQAWATSFPRNAGRDAMFYFGGSSRTSDLLDFLIWKHQADQLDIHLSFEDVCKEINRRCGKEVFTPDNFAANVENYLRYNQARSGATSDELIKAVTDEFRVVLAKEALLGSADGVPGWRTMFTLVRLSPAAVTPDEFLEYFRQQRTTVAVTMLPLSVERFRKEVTDTPSEATLRSLYEAYQDREPVPDQRVPGFKEPRRVRLAWFSFSPKAEHYKKKAARLGGLPPLLRIGAGANNYAAGGGPAVWAVQVAMLANDNRHFAAYGAYQEEERRQFATDLGVGFDIKDRRPLLERPEVAASLVGRLAGASGIGGASALLAPLSLRGTAALYEVKTLQHFGSAMLAGGTNSLGSVVSLPLAFTHTTMPLESVLPRMQEQFEEALAREIAIQDVTALGKEMERIKNPADHPAEVERVLREAAAKYGLEDVHVMKEPRTAFELREDPGPDLEKLKKAYDDCLEKEIRDFYRQFQPQLPPFPDFVGAVLEGKGVNPPYWSENLARTGQNIPPGRREDRRLSNSAADFQVFHEKDKSRPMGQEMGRMWMFWRIQDKPARTHSFEEVRDEILQAWKTEQARVLAKKEAQRIVNELKQRKGTPADAVRFLREQKKEGDQLIELNRVARQVPISDFLVGARNPRRFKPFQLPPKTIAYPSSDMLDKILAMQEPGDATVVTDRPQMHFYVTVLMERDVPSVREFAEIYREPVSLERMGDEPTLWQQIIADKREEMHQKLMEQLRAEAGKVDDQGNLVISDKARERQDRSSEGD
jgi:hypothetical protein